MNPNKENLRSILLQLLVGGVAVRVAAAPHEAKAIGNAINALLDILVPKTVTTPEPEAA